MKTRTISAFVALVLALPAVSMAQKNQIPLDDADKWYSEVYAGSLKGTFAQGPRRGAGAPGSMAFDKYDNAYVACGTFVYVITPDGNVSLLAGVPGTPGKADGPASRACFGQLAGIAVGPDGFPYVSDKPNNCIKKIHRDESGAWTVTTVAGVPGQKGRKDGPAKQALFKRLDCITFGYDDAIYVMDQDWLRRIKDNQVTTLNPKGGTGYFEGALEKARFRRIMGAGAISADDAGNIYLGDRWSNVFRKVDLKKGETAIIAGGPARGQKGFNRRARWRDGDALKEAAFCSGGGPCSTIYDAATGNIYTKTADEHPIRVITPDGNVRTLGPWKRARKPVYTGPAKETAGGGGPMGVDRQGRVYYAPVPGLICRFYRDPLPEGAKKPEKGPNPLIPKESVLRKPKSAGKAKLAKPEASDKYVRSGDELLLAATGEYQAAAAVAAGANEYLVAWQEGYSGLGSRSAVAFCTVGKDGNVTQMRVASADGTLEAPAVAHASKAGRYLIACQHRPDPAKGYGVSGIMIDSAAKSSSITQLVPSDGNALEPAVASDGENFFVAWRKLVDDKDGPRYEIAGRLFDGSGKPKSEPVQLALKAKRPTVTFDGRIYVVAYSTGNSVWTKRLDRKGALIGDESVKMGGLWEHRPAAAGNGEVTVVTAARRPNPNPWGWNGPGCIAIGRLTRDGTTPERSPMNYADVVDGGYASVVDAPKWRGHKGWPAGRPGGFKKTESGYWPHLYSSVCWDGKAWLVVWVRGKLDFVSIYDHDIFALRVDPATMMNTSVPTLIAGGDDEPGSKSVPALASLGDGNSLMVYQAVQPDGRTLVAARLLTGGAATGPPRKYKEKKKK
jgi:hypothetical protein